MKAVIIGAGVVGATAALTLAENGAEVVLLDRGSVAGEASGLNAGVIGGGGWGDRPDIDVALKMGSRDRYLDLVDQRGHDIGLDRTGTLTLLRTEDELAWALATVEADRAAGRSTELLDPAGLRQLEPDLDPDLLGAILDPLGLRAEPVAATRAFALEAERAGATLLTDTAVTGLRPTTGGGWTVDLDLDRAAETIGADVVIIAAGPWCADLGRLVDVQVPIVAVRGQMWASRPIHPMLRHAIASAESLTAWAGEDATPDDEPPMLTHRGQSRRTRHLYGRQRPNGELVFGGDRVLTTDRAVDDEGIAVNHGHVAELVPLVGDLPVVRTWTGAMPFSLDGRPLVGPIPGHDGLFLAGGLASSGFGRGPMTGRLVAELAAGTPPSADVSALDPLGRVTPTG